MDKRRYILDELNRINMSATDVSAETNFILEKILKVKNLYFSQEITKEEIKIVSQIITQRLKGYPLQYIANIAEFMRKDFYVNESVLIPRPETEILVTETLKKIKNFSSVLDIGTGSGCIAIMVADNIKNINVSASDISLAALEVAKINAKKMNVNINFIHSDLFENIFDTFDIIVSNPPYIPEDQRIFLQKELAFEPQNALFATDEAGVCFYEKIIRDGRKHLNKNGYILFELGINQSEIVKKIFLEYNYTDVEIIKDFDNIDRVIMARIL